MWNLRQSAGGVPSGEVHYEGRLVETGALFDSSRARGKPFRFTLGEGKVIGGWEVGVSSMQVPESGRRLSAVARQERAYLLFADSGGISTNPGFGRLPQDA